ncbi:ubiquitin-activating enzyme 1 [Rhynchospora pubera]|uniref:Ubiquitin-activating enzyme 1 n=1 Tax=Rhynchospora pubera TaxID=906938 RepID=A0AAV8HQ29_9POAL|nr:ubiquitin-activating enzyme 1 [Rhynchospora pubera]
MLPQKRAAGSDAEGHVSDGDKTKRSKNSEARPSSKMDNGSNGVSTNLPPIDEDLHSRQLAVYGRETMRRLFASNVLISGLNGLGAEIAKNLVLAGVKSVTLHDVEKVEIQDLSSNFFLTEEDVGTNRALACVKKLGELNNAVFVNALTEDLSEDNLLDYQVVVFTDIGLEKAIQFNEYCRNQSPPIAFIKAEIRGLFGGIFCDFGPEFTVIDTDGEEPRTGIIASISNDNPALISCVDDERLEFQDGNYVLFSEVKGMTELNDGKPRKIKVTRAHSFVLEEDTTNFGVYEKGGIVTEVKQPKVLKFKSLRESLREPGA